MQILTRRNSTMSTTKHVQNIANTNTSCPQDKAQTTGNTKHPVMLLNELDPGTRYLESLLGGMPGKPFSMTVQTQGQYFHGIGRNKKEARKVCAMAALKALHGIE